MLDPGAWISTESFAASVEFGILFFFLGQSSTSPVLRRYTFDYGTLADKGSEGRIRSAWFYRAKDVPTLSP